MNVWPSRGLSSNSWLCLSVRLFLCVSLLVYLGVHVSVCLRVHVSLRLCVCASVCSSICFCVNLSESLLVCLWLCLAAVHLYVCVCVYAAGLFVVLRTRLCVSGFICEFDRIAVLIAWNSICYGRADRHDS